MIYKEVFDLRGTDAQQAIVKEALDAIKFPFERIKFPKGKAVIGWSNLNGQTLQSEHASADEGISPQHLMVDDGARHHEGDHPAKDTDHEPLEGEVDGRKWILGVFYPSSGNIYVDNALINYPDLAITTVSAEVAHSVDEFLPLSDQQRTDIMTLIHGGDSTEHGHSWWEKFDYGAEYYSLVGESFMILFTYAYSDLPFEGAHDFVHAGSPSVGSDVRKIIGIERTDYVAPVEPIPPMSEPEVPEPAPVEPVVEEPIVPEEPVPAPVEEPVTETPVEEPQAPNMPETPTEEPVPSVPVEEPTSPSKPVPAPAIEDVEFVRYGRSKVYHLPSHYEKKTNGVEVPVEDLGRLRICKYCQKHLPIDILQDLV